MYKLPTGWNLQVPVLGAGQRDVPGGGEGEDQERREISDHPDGQTPSGETELPGWGGL